MEPWIGDLALLVLSAILVERAFRRDATSFIYAAALGLMIALTDFNLTYLSGSTEVALLIEGLILLAVGVVADRLRRRIGREDASKLSAPDVEPSPRDAEPQPALNGEPLAEAAAALGRGRQPLRPRPPEAEPAGRIGFENDHIEVVLRPERAGQIAAGRLERRPGQLSRQRASPVNMCQRVVAQPVSGSSDGSSSGRRPDAWCGRGHVVWISRRSRGAAHVLAGGAAPRQS